MRISFATLLRDPIHLFAFGLGTGLSPIAPGTAGTLLGVALEIGMRHVGLPLAARAAIAVGLFSIGIWLTGESSRRLGVHDHPGIVLDEIAGFLLVMLAAPPGFAWLAAGFVLFRFFDIVKPWPIRDLDHRLRGGLGIMLDDALAGAYAGSILALARVI